LAESATGAKAPAVPAPKQLKVLVRETIADAGIELLRARFEVTVDTESRLEEILGDYDALIVRSATKVTAAVLEDARRLKVIGRAGVGVDNVDVDAATRRGVVVANAPESNIVSAAEHTIGLLMALARNIPQAHAALVQGRWERSRWGGVELADKTLGILGFGRIGRQVARRATGLQMKVVAHDPFVGVERFRELGVVRASLDEVLARADFLTLHLPLTDETRGSIGAAAFAAMRDGVRLVNAARGGLVDERALIEALESGKVAGAALDVFSEEPYSGPLLAQPNVVVTPHLAASTDEAQDRAGLIVAEQVAAALEGRLVSNAVNIPSIGPDDLEALGPFLPLAAKLGRLAVQLASTDVRRIQVEVHGMLADYDTRLVTVAVLNGAFHGQSEQPVNYVNAPLIASERGVEVVEEKRRSSRYFTNLLSVAIDGVRVAGTTIGTDDRHWLASALGFELEIELAQRMILLLYDDVPGVIGRIGTLLGEAGVNIANMTVSRNRRGGKALMAFSIDSPAPPALVVKLREGMDEAYFIETGGAG
jgi:D-3-phosphoglycerate dehydrogenase / 2-oxoglutarate reductase